MISGCTIRIQITTPPIIIIIGHGVHTVGAVDMDRMVEVGMVEDMADTEEDMDMVTDMATDMAMDMAMDLVDTEVVLVIRVILEEAILEEAIHMVAVVIHMVV